MYIYSHLFDFKISTQTIISDNNAIELLSPKSLSCHNVHTPAFQKMWCRQATDLFQYEITTNFRHGVLLVYDGIQGKCRSSGRVLFPRNKYRTFTKDEFKSSRLFGLCNCLPLCKRTLFIKKLILSKATEICMEFVVAF